MITGREAWNLIIGKYRLPDGFSCYYRDTKFSEWTPAKFNWCIYRDYYYQSGKNTEKHSYELCIDILYKDTKFPVTHFMWELNPFDFECLGIDYVDVGKDV